MHFGFVWDVSGIDGAPDTLRIYVNGSVAASQHGNLAHRTGV